MAEVAEPGVITSGRRARTPPPGFGGRVTPGEGQPPEQHMSHMSGTFQAHYEYEYDYEYHVQVLSK